MPKSLNFLSFAAVSALSIALISCASAPGKSGRKHDGPKTYTEEIRSKEHDTDHRSTEAKEYSEIQSLFAKGFYPEALQRLKVFDSKYPKSTFGSETHNLEGLCYLQSKRPLQAIVHFKKSLEFNPTQSERQYILYNLATAQLSSNQIPETKKTLDELNLDRLDSSTQLKAHFLRAKLHEKEKDYLKVVQSLLSGANLFNQPEFQYPELQAKKDLYEKQMDLALPRTDDIPGLEAAYSNYPDTFFSDRVLFRIATETLRTRERASAESYLQTFIRKYPKSKHFTDASDLLRGMSQENEISNLNIGILLPLTGKYAEFGNKSLRGIQLAFRIFERSKLGKPVNLFVEDTGETGEQAMEALEKLNREHQVVAIIGPLLSKNIQEITDRADRLGIPLISLAQQSGKLGGYVFQLAQTARIQAQELARQCIQNRKMSRFAVLYPKDKFGEEYSQLFWDAVEKLGGEIVGIESYASGETDFRTSIDKLVGLFYEDARRREWAALAETRRANGITKNTRKTQQYFKIPAIIDFDAVFIPDAAKTVSQILPTFEYRDAENVQFIGVATWNTPELIQRSKKYAEHALFVDSFFPDSTSPETVSFVNRFQSVYNSRPSTLEAFSYDAATVLDHIFLSYTGAPSRREVRDSLQALKEFPGVTGKITYTEGEFIRDLKLLTVQDGKIIEAGAPEVEKKPKQKINTAPSNTWESPVSEPDSNP